MTGKQSHFPKEITQLSFFFDNFRNSDEAAEYVISNDRGPGTFLLRPSTRSPGTLTLTISIDNNHARHVNVQQKPDDPSKTGVLFFIIPERSFSSFHDLYGYYTNNAIHNLEQVNNVKLLNPLNRHLHAASASTFSKLHRSSSLQTPEVTSDEIPPLPFRIGLGSELPSIEHRRQRSSLDSQGSESQRTSSSSNGSGTLTSLVAVGGIDHGNQCMTNEMAGFNKNDNSDFLEGIARQVLPDVQSFYPDNQQSVSKIVQSTKKDKRKEEKPRKEDKKIKKNYKKNKKAEMDELVQLGWCRPPMPTPETESLPDEEHPYYSSPRPYKNHLEELKKMLKESEICDCGLRMLDAELVDGWTVHRSREMATFKRVFYQHENGNTTWIFPASITDLLSVQQIEFIVYLCREAGQDVPARVMHRYQSIRQTATSMATMFTQSGSRSVSNSSDAIDSNTPFSRSISVEQRSPVSGPAGVKF